MNIMKMATTEQGKLSYYDTEGATLEPNTSYILPLIKMPKGYRLADDKDKAGLKPKGYKYMRRFDVGFTNGLGVGNMDWDPDIIYIVPKKQDNLAEFNAELKKAIDNLKEAADELLQMSQGQ